MNKRKTLEYAYNLFCFLNSKLPKGYSALPPVIIWFITYKCNLRCKMCGFYGQGGKIPDVQNELSFDEIKIVIDGLRKSYQFYPYKPYIGIIGGEPFIHPKIFEILEYLRKSGFSYSVTTNFVLLNEEKINRLVKIGINDLRISLDGPRDIHDEIRSARGTFDKMFNNLRYFRSIDKKTPIRLNCVISPMNLSRIQEIIPYAKELDASLSYQHLVFIDDAHRNENTKISNNIFDEDMYVDATSMTLSKNDVALLNKKYIEITDECKRQYVQVSFMPDLSVNDFDDYYFDLSGYVHQERCFWPWGTARITPEGNIYSCMHYIFGNLRNSSFKNIWNNERARKFRYTLKTIKLFPGCIRCCKI
ncbi:MAG: radical SAM protein [Candidatus Methanoperedens sp.]|nr:radical SAM protein [Candidatus Methanoperedens sp.]